MATGLIRRNGRYSIRRVIPSDLQSQYGRREIVRALGTATPAEARRLHARAWVELDDEFDARRAVVAGQGEPGPAPATVIPLPRPVVQPAPVPATKGVPLADVVDSWAAERKPTDRMARRIRNIVDRFEAVNGKLAIQAVTKGHVLAFKDALFAEGQSPANINVMIPILGIVMNFAMANDLIAANPAAGIRVADNRRAKEIRRAFEEAEVNAIFASPVYAMGARPVAGCEEAAYWLPLLALYTGARLEELGQLHPDDVTPETYRDTSDQEQSAWVVRFVDNKSRGQKLKNASSERRVPVHADLIALGFLKVAEAAKREGRSRIFHELNPSGDGKETANWSKWFGRYRRSDCGLTGKDTPFHSFRHSFKHFARLASIPADVHNKLTGHETGDVADGYGGLSYPLAPLVEGMKRYRVPGFKLPPPPAVS